MRVRRGTNSGNVSETLAGVALNRRAVGNLLRLTLPVSVTSNKCYGVVGGLLLGALELGLAAGDTCDDVRHLQLGEGKTVESSDNRGVVLWEAISDDEDLVKLENRGRGV